MGFKTFMDETYKAYQDKESKEIVELCKDKTKKQELRDKIESKWPALRSINKISGTNLTQIQKQYNSIKKTKDFANLMSYSGTGVGSGEIGLCYLIDECIMSQERKFDLSIGSHKVEVKFDDLHGTSDKYFSPLFGKRVRDISAPIQKEIKSLFKHAMLHDEYFIRHRNILKQRLESGEIPKKKFFEPLREYDPTAIEPDITVKISKTANISLKDRNGNFVNIGNLKNLEDVELLISMAKSESKIPKSLNELERELVVGLSKYEIEHFLIDNKNLDLYFVPTLTNIKITNVTMGKLFFNVFV